MIEGDLVASVQVRGRYTVGKDGPELNTGQRVTICVYGHWTRGNVAHGGAIYATESDGNERTVRGYYFVADDGSVCGLCVGMTVQT